MKNKLAQELPRLYFICSVERLLASVPMDGFQKAILLNPQQSLDILQNQL